MSEYKITLPDGTVVEGPNANETARMAIWVEFDREDRDSPIIDRVDDEEDVRRLAREALEQATRETNREVRRNGR